MLEIGILAFCLRCQDVLQLPFGKFLYGDLSPISSGTRFGKAFIAMTLGFALVSALALPGAGCSTASGCCGRRSRSRSASRRGSRCRGTTRSIPGRRGRRELADWVHLTAASLWVGGLIALVVVVWRLAPSLRREAFVRFSRLAVGLVGLVLAAGIYLAIVRLPALSDLWTHDYGRCCS